MELGLLYYNARFYAPGLGRFLSADSIVPDPTNPQSLNRYSYTRNSPLNLIDPTGHRECGTDCNNPRPNTPPPSIKEQIQQGFNNNVYGLKFSADAGESWTEEQVIVVLKAAAATDRLLRISGRLSGAMPGYAFRQRYNTYTMLRSSKTQYTDSNGVAQDIDYGGETFGWKNTIEFYDPAFGVDPLDPKFRNNVVHEFAHAFNAEIESVSDFSPYNDLEVALSEGGALSGFGRREGMADYPWQQHAGSNTKNEVFADYFLNTVYGSFLGNDAGVAQYEWMLVQMRNWSQ